MSDSTSKGIIKYSSRDYDSIMDDFWAVVPSIIETWRPEADADPGVVLGKFIASAADVLGISTDLLANEVFAPSVSQRKNAEKIFALIGYDLGWWTAGTTEVTLTNNMEDTIKIDLGFNGSSFCTLNAYTDITNQDRVITYNILPLTSSYGAEDSRSTRQIVSENINVFADTDIVTLEPGESCTRVAVEGELRSFNISVADVKANNYIFTLPSQHIDTTRVWIKAKSSLATEDFLETQWRQVANTADFIEPEPLFAVTYDNYSNARITVSNYLNQLENYESNYLVVYWIDTIGVIGSVGEDVLTNLIFAKDQDTSFESADITVSNLSNTVELPHTYTITGKSPETAHEAYLNSRNYINTYDSLITLPDYNRFLKRSAGVDAGVVIDCQKALEYNLSVYNDETLTKSQKSKMYITNYDFPKGSTDFDWAAVLNLGFDPSDPQKFVFSTNFKTYTAMSFCIHNDFKDSSFGNGKISKAKIQNQTKFTRYKPPAEFLSYLKQDFSAVKAMSVEVEFGFSRIFNFHVVGQIYTVKPVSQDVADNIVSIVKEKLAVYYAPANREYGQAPNIMEIVDIITKADSRISYFDAGSINNNVIQWTDCDIEYFNIISFARYLDPGATSNNIRVAPSCIVK